VRLGDRPHLRAFPRLALSFAIASDGGKRLGDVGRHQFGRHRPLEDPLHPVPLGVDIAAGPSELDHLAHQRLEGQRSELDC
jgi:hypothetical protein